MHDWGFDAENYPVVILDLLYPEYYTFENKSFYEGYYYISSYSLYNDNTENTQMKSIIELFYGNLPIQMHEDSVAAYNYIAFIFIYSFSTMILVSSAMGSVFIESSSELRYKIYKLSDSTPYGQTEIATSNLIKSYFNIHSFNSETDFLLLSQDHVFDRSPFSAMVYIYI